MATMTDDMTPEQWLEEQFEFEVCGECYGDVADHLCLVDFPFPGTFFAQCLTSPVGDDPDIDAVRQYLERYR